MKTEVRHLIFWFDMKNKEINIWNQELELEMNDHVNGFITYDNSS